MSSPPHGRESAPIKLPPPRRTLLQRMALWVEHAHALRGWVEEARGHSAALDATFETIERDSRVGGGILAGALSYRLFVFALPLAFFTVSGLGLLASTLGVEPHVVSNSVGLAGIVTKQVESAAKGDSSWWVALASFFVLVYATRVLLRAIAIVHSLAWEGSAASVKVPPRSLGIFGAVLAGQLVLVAGVGAVNHQTAIGGILTLVAFVFALAGLWLIVSLELPHADARWTDLIPGTLLYAVGYIGILLFNILILGHLIETKTSTYGALGTAATLLLAFFLLGRVIVGAAVLNATLYERSSRSHGLPSGRSSRVDDARPRRSQEVSYTSPTEGSHDGTADK
jgi:membrane protein